MKNLILFFVALSASMGAFAQIPGTKIPPRTDDHFQRNLVVNRIDMEEKINQPLVQYTDPGLYASATFGEGNGMINALFNGLKSGKYLAYAPDSLNKSLTYEDVLAALEKLQGIDPFEEEFEEDPFFLEEDSEFMYDIGGDVEGDTDISSQLQDLSGGQNGFGQDEEIDLSGFESVVEFIENRIFDKNRSAIVNDIQYIRLVWVDPGETLPDENVLCFKYSDVLETLEDCQWTNKYNDAEHRNMREIFENRLFSGFVTNVSGRGIATLEEAEYRRNQMLDFEHQLWSY